MEFLPFHFLLATVVRIYRIYSVRETSTNMTQGNAGYLKYTDTSTGKMVIEMPTRMGSPTSLTQNPANAVCLSLLFCTAVLLSKTSPMETCFIEKC